MMTIENLEAGYGDNMVLRGVSIKVSPGDVVCIMGRNGVGKTTLMKSIMGLLPAKKGSIFLDGNTITRETPDKRARAGIGYIPQGREIFAHLTVEENLLLGLEATGTGKNRVKTIPDDIYDLFPVLRTMLKRRGGDLSGGQQQQLAIARVLASRPKVLLLDEPMEGIQPSIVQEIEDILEKLKATRSMGILLVEQALSFASSIADYVYVLDRGQVVAEGDRTTLDAEAIKRHLLV
jgi:urea transport system ATP-binding protein